MLRTLHRVLIALVVTFAFSESIARAQTHLSVDLDNVIQPNFLGVGAVYHGFSYMPESNAKGMTDDLRNVEFDRVSRIRLPLARTWYGSDWAMPQWGGAYDWNSEKMTAFYAWLQAMKDRNVDVAINAGWWMTESACGSAAPSTCTPRPVEDVDIYTKWVSDSLHELTEVRGFTNVKYIMFFTEPLTYCGCGGVPDGYTQQSFYFEVAHRLDAQLKADGRRSLVKIVGPDDTAVDASIGKNVVSDAISNANDVFDIYSGHTYSMAGYNEWNAAAVNGTSTVAPTGKPFWFDEYGKQDEQYRGTSDYGTYLAEAQLGIMNAGAQTSLIWLYQDQYYTYPLNDLTNTDSFDNGLHKWGTMFWLPYNTAVRPSWHAFALLSRYLGGAGTAILSSQRSANDLRISAVRMPDGNTTIVVVNANTGSSADLVLDFSRDLGVTMYRHLYDPANVPGDDTIIGASEQFDNVGSNLTDSIPARSVAVYTSIQN